MISNSTCYFFGDASKCIKQLSLPLNKWSIPRLPRKSLVTAATACSS